MTYVDLNTIHNPATGTIAPAAWGDQIRDNLEFLIDPPACSVSSGNQSVNSGTPTVLTAGTENFDNDGMHSTVSNTSRITIQTAGRYLFMSVASFAQPSGSATLSFLIDGATSQNGVLLPVTGGTTRLIAVRLFTLAVGQYVETRVTQDSGGAINIALIEFGATFLTRA